ncbi:unnamed protein product [Lactuca virosa]|uniref:Uncharacterized protein n=1 Tax=Lactuca virosa TaxID=75947 RepID=A0AAU9N6K6_9ASTR|nr:unnamed protein product [Lactuca virosa]
MSNTSSQALGSADESGYVTARPKVNRDSSTEPTEDPSTGSETGEEVSSQAPTEETSAPPIPEPSRQLTPRPPLYGLCHRRTARKIAPMLREVLRFERHEPVPAPPAPRSERHEPSQPRPPVIGTPYMRAPGMTCQERRSMEAMARDVHDARSRIAYHHHSIADMSDVVDAVCGYAYTAQRTAIRAMITSAIAGGLALILAVALVWVIVFWG